jgi:hypothetical protein
LAENVQLRTWLPTALDCEQTASAMSEDWEQFRTEPKTCISAFEVGNKLIVARLQQGECDNQEFAERYVEIEEGNINLASFDVATYPLHSKLDASEVLNVILAIVVNLVGAEVCAIYVFDDKKTFSSPSLPKGESLKSVQSRAGPVARRRVGLLG